VLDLFEDKSIGQIMEHHIKNASSSGLLMTCKIKQQDILKQTRFYECRFLEVFDGEVMMIARDVTREEISENNLKIKVEELKKTNTKLNEYIKSNEELEKFAYIASHDLKEPIRNISFFAQYLKRQENLTEESQNYINEIIERSFKMKNLIDDLLFYSKVENQELHYEKFNLKDLVNDVVKKLDVLIKENKATIEIENDIKIYADRFLFMRLFYNLIQNSIKYQSDKKPEVVIKAKETNNQFSFDFIDNGIGIPTQYHDYIFGVFKKIKQNGIDGVGLGLSICKRIIERHNGAIKIYSDINQGATFSITISK